MGQIDINGAHCFDDAEAKMENKISDEILKQISEGEFIDPCINRPHLLSQSWSRKNVLFASDIAADLLSARKELERVKDDLSRLDRHYRDAVKMHNKQLDIALTNCSKTNAELSALQEQVKKLKDKLSENGEYSICKSDGSKLNIADAIEIGNVFEEIDKLLPVPPKGGE
jgi:flagellar motility protein MotE (MotC chaperone)